VIDRIKFATDALLEATSYTQSICMVFLIYILYNILVLIIQRYILLANISINLLINTLPTGRVKFNALYEHNDEIN